MFNPFKSLTFVAVILCLSDHWSTYSLSSQHYISALGLFLNSFNLSSICVFSYSAKSETFPIVFISGSVGIFTVGSRGTDKSFTIGITTSTNCLYNYSEEKVLAPSDQAWWANSHPNSRYQMKIYSFAAVSIAVSLPRAEYNSAATSIVIQQQG